MLSELYNVSEAKHPGHPALTWTPLWGGSLPEEEAPRRQNLGVVALAKFSPCFFCFLINMWMLLDPSGHLFLALHVYWPECIFLTDLILPYRP